MAQEHAFAADEVRAVYRAIRERRDMRHFAGGEVAPEVLQRLLEAAHHAPSVGFMQPWRFIRIRDAALRRRLHDVVERERVLTARALGEREDEFMRLKVQGLLDAAELLAVSLADDRDRHVFGRRTLPQMDLASASCAIQNLWLAARAEGLGMGWVSLFDPVELSTLLGLPEGAEPIALLCLGPVHDFYEEPMLQRERWAKREPLSALVFDERWGQPSDLFSPHPVCRGNRLMLAFDTVLFEIARLFLWPVTLGVLLSFVYAVYCLGAFGIEYLQRRRDPSRVLALQRHAEASQEQMELVVLKHLEGVRLCSRVAPMLGLIATMIPMGPALVAVASGESQGVAQSLAPAFAAVIVALASASITFVVYTVRRRWLMRELVTVLDARDRLS
jgi:5,6-dimethylbenzimidazole synthase